MKKRYVLLTAVLFVMPAWFGGASTAATTEEEPQYGGSLRFLGFAPANAPVSWDNYNWHHKHGNDTGPYLEHLLTGDLRKGPRGSNEFSFAFHDWLPREVLRGELAESWEVKEDPLRIIFHLRKGILWQEKPGVMKAREFVADDVVYSMTRLAASPVAQPLYLEFIDRWGAADRHTAVAYLKEWNSSWDYRFGWGYYDAIQPPEMEQAGAGDWRNACGTGPYMITNYRTGHSQIYVKNPHYWDHEVIDSKEYQLPFTDKLVRLIIKDETTQLVALQTGKVDLAFHINWKHVDTLQRVNPHLRWSRCQFPTAFMLALRMDTPPFDDIRVRRALNLAVNQQEIADSFFKGRAELHTFPWPSAYENVHTPLEELPPTARELFTYNPEKARSLLAEAGYPDGFTFKAQISTLRNGELDVAAMVVAYLARVGVTLELETMDEASRLSRLSGKTHGPGHFPLITYGTPYSAIRKNFLPGQTWNAFMMDDEEITQTYHRTVSDPDLPEAEQLVRLKKLGVRAIELAPAILLPREYVYQAWWPWVKNYHGEIRCGAMRPSPILSRIWIDQELKKKMGK